MPKLTVFILFFIGLTNAFAQKTYDYPSVFKDTASNSYFDTVIEDPYQWMENVNDERLLDWFDFQSKLVRKVKRKLPVMDLRVQVATMYNGVKEKDIDDNMVNDKVSQTKYEFKFKNQNLNRFPNLLYRLRDDGNYKRLIDIRKLALETDDNIEVYSRYINEEHDLAAIKIARNGSDWCELYFFNLKTGEQFPNILKHIRRSSNIVWDGTQVYYDKFDPPLEGRELLDVARGQKLFYHELGKTQSQDRLLFINPDITGKHIFRFGKINDKLFFYNPSVQKDLVYRTIAVATVTTNAVDFTDFIVYPNENNIELAVEVVFGDKILIKTNWDAPNGRVLLADLNNPNQPIEIIPEYDVMLKYVNQLGKDKFVCVYKNGNSELALIFDLEGKLLKRIDFPEGKKVNYLYENKESAEFTDFCVSSFYHPELWYQLSLTNLTFKPTTALSVPYDPEALETRFVKYESKDGTEIPMYITCLKDLELNGKNPTLLYGYGGYGSTIEPFYDESNALWLLKGGVLAIPNVRGGGAEGLEWSLQGKGLKKQNTIDDFVAAAEYLIDENYTNSGQLGAAGGSHGALLVTAAAVQRPELFKAIVAEAGPYDMLRFENYTVGAMNENIKEFGSVKNQVQFENLKSYSPLHNLSTQVSYPNMLLITGEGDDRVPPFHSYKFLATLQEKATPEALYLLYQVPGSGHGGALNTHDWFDKLVYKYAFLYDQLF